MDNKKLLEITENHTDNAIKLILSYENFEREVSKEEIEEGLYIAIMFIGICLDKFDYGSVDQSDFCIGFKYIYNVIKHSNDPFELNYFNFSKSSIVGMGRVGQARVGMNAAVEWSDISSGCPNQYEKFKHCLLGKEVKYSLKNILGIVKENLI